MSPFPFPAAGMSHWQQTQVSDPGNEGGGMMHQCYESCYAQRIVNFNIMYMNIPVILRGSLKDSSTAQLEAHLQEGAALQR